MKQNLTDRTLKSLKPAAKPYEVMDTVISGFGVRVMGKPAAPVRSFVIVKRFPGSSNPTRRTLGTYGELTLEEGRQKARAWLDMIDRGVDPAKEAERQRQETIEAERARQAATFGAALDDYLRIKASKLKSGPDIEREMRREFAEWMKKPIAEITRTHIESAIEAIIGRGATTQAHTLFAMLRGFFNWCVDSGRYGMEVSPCVKIKPAVLIGERNIRSRILKDFEIAAYWRAAEKLEYPFGPFFKLLALTAVRRAEAAEAQWREIDFDAGTWIIPAERMKAGAAHLVPLVPDIAGLLRGLPRFSGGDFIFSTTGGKRPVSGFSKAKARLDMHMQADLKGLGKPFEAFTVHDVRRTCRTRFSALPVEDVVRELLLAHTRPGLHRVYDLHRYEEEKAYALKLWHAKLKAIIESKPENVIPFTVAKAG